MKMSLGSSLEIERITDTGANFGAKIKSTDIVGNKLNDSNKNNMKD